MVTTFSSFVYSLSSALRFFVGFSVLSISTATVTNMGRGTLNVWKRISISGRPVFRAPSLLCGEKLFFFFSFSWYGFHWVGKGGSFECPEGREEIEDCGIVRW